MVLLQLSKETVDDLRRNTFIEMQKIGLELQRHRAQCPADMEDKDYTALLNSRYTAKYEIFEACCNGLRPQIQSAKS